MSIHLFYTHGLDLKQIRVQRYKLTFTLMLKSNWIKLSKLPLKFLSSFEMRHLFNIFYLNLFNFIKINNEIKFFVTHSSIVYNLKIIN